MLDIGLGICPSRGRTHAGPRIKIPTGVDTLGRHVRTHCSLKSRRGAVWNEDGVPCYESLCPHGDAVSRDHYCSNSKLCQKRVIQDSILVKIFMAVVWTTPNAHIVNSCPFTKFEGSLMILHEAEDDAVNWLNSVSTTALAKEIITRKSFTKRRGRTIRLK